MDFYKNLPAPARIGIPAVLAVILAFLVYSMAFKPAAPIKVIESKDIGVYKAAMTILNASKVPFTQEVDTTKGTFTLKVPADQKVQAATALKGSGISDLSGSAKAIKCPTAPGFTGTSAQNERVDKCEAAKAVQTMLTSAGAVASNVLVSKSESENLLGPEKETSVVAQVFLSPTMEHGGWNAADAAAAIAGAVDDVTIKRVTITDDKFNMLFNGANASTSGGGGTSTPAASDDIGGSTTSGSTVASEPAACKDMATATEITAKATAVSDCTQYRIQQKLNAMLGSDAYAHVSAVATIDGNQSTSSSTKNSPGPSVSSNTQKGSGSSSTNQETQPNTTTTSTVNPAGDISKLALAVSLDSNHVSKQEQLAVMQLLQTYVVAARKDPAPQISRYPFPKAESANKDTQAEILKDIKDKAQGTTGATTTTPVDPGTVQTQNKTPRAMLALMAMLAVGILFAVLYMWRRTQQIAAERMRYEQEFRNQQQVLDTYAQQDPAALAADLEKMFGLPPAQEPTYL